MCQIQGRPNLESIAERVGASTPGEWTVCDGYEIRAVHPDGAEYPLASLDGIGNPIGHPWLTRNLAQASADGEFISNAPSDIREMLRYIHKLEEMLNR